MESIVEFDRVGKKFSRDRKTAVSYGFQDLVRGALRLKPVSELRTGEFWALRDLSFALNRGECLGIIGPNGAGKTTLLRLVNREHRPATGRVVTHGRTVSLFRPGAGLQPQLTGRENIYVRCAGAGFSKQDVDAMLPGIVEFAGLSKSIDMAVRRYSDGMYSRLEFAIGTCVVPDILLVDEYLAAGDLEFQARCLDRLGKLKQAGTAIFFVSHAESLVRQITDRCLLLIDGECLAVGETDALFRAYYRALGMRYRELQPLGASPAMQADVADPVALSGMQSSVLGEAGRLRWSSGQPADLTLRYRARQSLEDCAVVIQFWDSVGVLVASYDSGVLGRTISLAQGPGGVTVRFPIVGLTAGVYRVAGGFRRGDCWLGYRAAACELAVTWRGNDAADSLFYLAGDIVT